MFKINQIYNADCLIAMSQIKDSSIDAVVTDPPYGTNYGKVKGDEDLNTFIKSLAIIFRVLKSDTFFVTYCWTKSVPIIIQEAEKVGFSYLWIGFNYYPNMFKQKPQPLGYNRYDLFLIFGKGNPKKRGIIKDTIHILMDKKNYKERKGGHPHQKPLKCWEKILKAVSNEGDLILDPFAGTGGSCLIAKHMKRNYLGFEIDSAYCKAARKFINTTVIVEDKHV